MPSTHQTQPAPIWTNAEEYDRLNNWNPTSGAANQPDTRCKPNSNIINKTLIIQWNMNGFFNNLVNLEILVHEHRPIILAIQEVHKATVSQLNNTLGKRYDWYLAREQEHSHRSAEIGIIKSYPNMIISEKPTTYKAYEQL